LSRLIVLEYERARANPLDRRYTDLGITKWGGLPKKADAQKSIEEAFGDLQALINHITILDMAAAFEGLFKAQIATAVGEARKTLKGKHKETVLAGRERLVREAKDFQGLSNIMELISPNLDERDKERLESVRENRNRFTHGTDITAPPTIRSDDAREALNNAIDLLKPI